MTRRFLTIARALPYEFHATRQLIQAMAIAGVLLTAVSTATRANEDGSSDDGDYEFVSSADMAGPRLREWSTNSSYMHYNRAVELYTQGNYPEALQHMRAAVRARQFGHPTIGLAFSNLCMMYLKVGKYKNAQAACTKALSVLPGYVPAALNLARAKKHMAPEG